MKKVVYTSIGMVILISVLSILVYFDIINKVVFYIVLFMSIMTMFVLFVVMGLKWLNKNKVDDPIKGDGSGKRLDTIFERINQELKNLPFAPVLSFGRGDRCRYERKMFSNSDGRPCEFMALLAPAKGTSKDVIVYYNFTEDKLCSYNGFPSATQLSNIWSGFEPFPTSNTFDRFDRRHPSFYDKRGYKKRKNLKILFDDEEPYDERYTQQNARDFASNSNIPDTIRR